MKDMNRSVLLIPILCGDYNSLKIDKLLKNTRQKEIRDWDKKNILYTQNKLRREIFTQKSSSLDGQESGNITTFVA